MNKKGFILSTYVYILLTFFLLILGTTLVVLNNTKMLAKKIKDESIQSSGMDAKFSIILQGEKEIEIFKDTTFTDPGYIAQTTKGEILEAVVNSNVDTSNAGDYVIIYTVTYNGETKRKTRNVKVLNRIIDFTFIESAQKFIVPQTGTYQIELWGAQGGSYNDTYYGGKGAYVLGNIYLNKNDELFIYVGEEGESIITPNTYKSGGYNGGGESTTEDASGSYSSTGGGSTDIRINSNNIFNRIIVAGGGGGSDYSSATSYGYGGAGGTLEGISSLNTYTTCIGSGGTQISGGISSCTYLANGELLNGGGLKGNNGAGGGGYYGGSSGYGYRQGGYGGSSYISGYTGCVAVTSEGDPKPGCANETTDNSCSIHYSNKVFTDSVMIAGNASMPTHDGESTMIGNEGNGYAKITYVGE